MKIVFGDVARSFSSMSLQRSRWEGNEIVSDKSSLLCPIKLIISELHKESRRLENEVDLKLLSCSKLGSNFAQRDSRWAVLVIMYQN